MKAKNNKEIYDGYIRFSLYLGACIFIGVLFYFCYTRTSVVEVEAIVGKTEEYDKVYTRQLELANRIDSLYYYLNLFNTNYNDKPLQYVVSQHKQEISVIVEGMNDRDTRVYQSLMRDFNMFLNVKDSIRILKLEEEIVREDLLKCVEANKATSRRLSFRNINAK